MLTGDFISYLTNLISYSFHLAGCTASVFLYTSLFTVNGSKGKKMKHTQKTSYLQHISSASHTVESTDKFVLPLCKLFTWQSKIMFSLNDCIFVLLCIIF